jgi:hypothetical protein
MAAATPPARGDPGCVFGWAFDACDALDIDGAFSHDVVVVPSHPNGTTSFICHFNVALKRGMSTRERR